jgi:peptide-methionine (R)-S-oxide reductase
VPLTDSDSTDFLEPETEEPIAVQGNLLNTVIDDSSSEISVTVIGDDGNSMYNSSDLPSSLTPVTFSQRLVTNTFSDQFSVAVELTEEVDITPVLREPLSGYINRTMDPVVLRTDAFFSVINLSSLTLSLPQLSLLSRGLKFTPLPNHVDRLSLKESLNTFTRRLRLTEYFADRDSCTRETPSKFRIKSSWTPPPNRDKFLDSYISIIESEIMNSTEQRSFANLSKDERRAVKDLQRNSDIIIREADKGSGVVIMDKERYLAESYRHLNDTTVYNRVGSETNSQLIRQVGAILEQAKIDSIITEDMFEYARPINTKPARFYILPKVHKAGVPGRPVVSACGSPTEGLSEIVDHFLQPFMTAIPSYIKDTNDFLHKVRSLGSLPSGTILATIDVVSLYPSIPHTNGLTALRSFLLQRGLPEKAVQGISILAETVLTKNVFEFNSEFFLQKSGTAIGTKMAPAYANVFMCEFERDLLSRSVYRPYAWFRFIDDIFLVWTEGEERLKEFLTFMNSLNPSIQFTSDFSYSRVNFLDVSVSLGPDGTITTDLFVKPTDTHQYLQWTSCHPNHIKKSIPYSQALRILRICSDLETAKTRCDELADYLIRRGYSSRLVRRQINRAINHHTNPQPRSITGGPRKVFFSVDFHPSLPDISGILRRFLPVLHQSEKLRRVVPEPPVISFKQPKNLGRMLCRAKIRNTPNSGDEHLDPCKPCGAKRCQLCPLLVTSDRITSTSNGRTFSCRNSSTNCNSLWSVYVVSCPDCGLQYVGQTNNIRLRMNGHKSDLRKFIDGTSNKSESVILYQHLKEHSQAFRFQIVETLPYVGKRRTELDNRLDSAEREWIWKLDSITPKGLNVDDGFHVQNRKSRKFKRS